MSSASPKPTGTQPLETPAAEQPQGDLPAGAPPARSGSSVKPGDLKRLAGLSLRVEVTAGRGEITLGRLRRLQAGDTLKLDRRGDGPLLLICGAVKLGEVEVEAAGMGLEATLLSLEGSSEEEP
ncbi:MAG: FliM/FliN family flagellar motor C-terminal domain-containing protein [Acidobacteriota bacterium]